MAIHKIVVKIFDCGPKWWINQHGHPQSCTTSMAKDPLNQTDITEPVATKLDCCVASCHLCLDHYAAPSYSWQTTSLYVLHLLVRKQLSTPPGGGHLNSSFKKRNRKTHDCHYSNCHHSVFWKPLSLILPPLKNPKKVLTVWNTAQQLEPQTLTDGRDFGLWPAVGPHKKTHILLGSSTRWSRLSLSVKAVFHLSCSLSKHLDLSICRLISPSKSVWGCLRKTFPSQKENRYSLFLPTVFLFVVFLFWCLSLYLFSFFPLSTHQCHPLIFPAFVHSFYCRSTHMLMYPHTYIHTHTCPTETETVFCAPIRLFCCSFVCLFIFSFGDVWFMLYGLFLSLQSILLLSRTQHFSCLLVPQLHDVGSRDGDLERPSPDREPMLPPFSPTGNPSLDMELHWQDLLAIMEPEVTWRI